MHQINWRAISFGAMLILAAEAFVGFGLLFNPGWVNPGRANKWPLDVPIDVIWAGGLSAFLFVFYTTAIITAGCLAIAVGVRRGYRRPRWWLITALPMIVLVVGLVMSVWVFKLLQMQALSWWPNGYDPT
jgi:hypothetical protein